MGSCASIGQISKTPKNENIKKINLLDKSIFYKTQDGSIKDLYDLPIKGKDAIF